MGPGRAAWLLVFCALVAAKKTAFIGTRENDISRRAGESRKETHLWFFGFFIPAFGNNRVLIFSVQSPWSRSRGTFRFDCEGQASLAPGVLMGAGIAAIVYCAFILLEHTSSVEKFGDADGTWELGKFSSSLGTWIMDEAFISVVLCWSFGV